LDKYSKNKNIFDCDEYIYQLVTE